MSRMTTFISPRRALVRTLLPLAVALAAAPVSAHAATSTADPAFGAADPTTRSFVGGEVIVGFRDSSTGGERARVSDSLGADVTGRPLPRTQLLDLPAGTTVNDAIDQFDDADAVAYVQPNYIRHVEATPDDTLLPQLWAVRNSGQQVDGVTGTADADIDATEAWDTETGSSSTTVAVVDTGLDAAHPDIAANVWTNPGEIPGNGIDDDADGKIDDVHGWDYVDGDATPQDGNGHGTHVAGTIGADGNNALGTTGVSWDVSLMPLRVLNNAGTGTDANIAAAFLLAGNKGADVVNASLGGAGTSPVMRNAVNSSPGTLFVVAAGNDGANDDTTPTDPCTIPAANLICVAASDQSDGLASFSNYGSTSVDLAAPGVNILSTIAAGSPFAVYTDHFESGMDWSTGGTGNAWGLSTGAYASPTHSLADSPAGNYANSANSYAVSPLIDLSGLSSCTVGFPYLPDLASGDVLYVEGSTNGTTWTQLGQITGSTSGSASYTLGSALQASGFRLRLRLQTDATGTADGVYVDDVSVHCSAPAGSYDYLDGTSMATPQVAGTAALLVSADPGASVAELRSALLSGVEAKGGLSGKVATGGRLNAANALAALLGTTPSPPPTPTTPTTTTTTTTTTVPPPTTTDPTPTPVDRTPPGTELLKGPSAKTRSSRAQFSFTSSESGSTFRCELDRGGWRECASPFRARGLKKGRHTFEVQAVDAAGNADPSPEVSRWRVVAKRR